MLDYLSTFFYSGLLMAGVKYVSTKLDSSFAPIVSGLPLGIIGGFFINGNEKKHSYYEGYTYSSCILAMCVFAIYILSIAFTDISVNIISIIGLFMWFIISLIFIKMNGMSEPNKKN